jgi:hypothetical protein
MNAPLYGILGADNQVLIVDNRNVAAEELAEPRRVRRGQSCASITKADIIDYLWWMNTDPPNPGIAVLSNPQLVRDEVARTFSPEEAANFTAEELAYAYSWARLPRQELCAALYEALQTLNLLVQE